MNVNLSQEAGAHPSTRWRSVCELLDAQSARTPTAPAASFPTSESTYAELGAASIVAARKLRAAGIRAGDRVGILLREGCEPYVSLGLGAMRLGAICVPINARNKTHELEYVVDHAGLSLLVTVDEFVSLLDAARLPETCTQVVLGRDTWFDEQAESVSVEEVAGCEATVAPDTPALILYTSGTTANPKGCVHSHATLLGVGYNTAHGLELTSADRYWTALAMFHVGGWQVLLANLSAGSCFSHVGFFEPGQTLHQIARERCTVVMPAFELIWMAVLEHPDFAGADLSAVRTVMNVGVPERLERMQAMVPHATQVSMFGSTESAGSICIGSTSDSLHSRTHSSGRPLPGMELKLIDPATGEECAPGVPGELFFRGPSRFVEYWRDPRTTADTIDADGWARTGDLVRIESDGAYAFVSRLKDMLKVGGENASAAEIEGYLITHPAVSVVAVVAAPDARYGEVPCAFVKTAGGAEVTERDLIDFCLGKIATFKVPRYVRFLDDFPIASSSAKIQKYALRERIEDELKSHGIVEAPKLDSGSRRPA
jgi:fatty-acyl-CoA synthase